MEIERPPVEIMTAVFEPGGNTQTIVPRRFSPLRELAVEAAMTDGARQSPLLSPPLGGRSAATSGSDILEVSTEPTHAKIFSWTHSRGPRRLRIDLLDRADKRAAELDEKTLFVSIHLNTSGHEQSRY